MEVRGYFDYSSRLSLIEKPVWEDLRFPVTQTKLGSNSLPNFDYTNIGLLFPQGDTSEIIYMIAQMPHGYFIRNGVAGSNIRPHIHYIQTTSSIPTFVMDYKWYDNGGIVPTTYTKMSTKGYGEIPYVTGTTMLQILSFPEIDGSHIKGASSILDIKISRNDGVVTGDVLVKEFDIHYLSSRRGTFTEFA